MKNEIIYGQKPDVGCYCYDYEKIILNGGSEN